MFVGLGLWADEVGHGIDYDIRYRYHQAQLQISDSVAFMLIADSLETEGIEMNDLNRRVLSADLKANFFFVRGNALAMQYLEQAADLAKQANLIMPYFSYLQNSGAFLIHSKLYNDAIDMGNRIISEAKEMEYYPGLCNGYQLLGDVYSEIFQRQNALKQYQQAIDVIAQHPDYDFGPLEYYSLDVMADIYCEMGDFENAEAYAKRAMQIDDHYIRMPYIQADKALRNGDKKAFKRYYDQFNALPASVSGAEFVLKPKFEIMRCIAEGHTAQAYEMAAQIYNEPLVYHEILEKIAVWSGQWERAYQTLSTVNLMKDSLVTQLTDETLAKMSAEIETIYQTKEKEEEILRQRYTLYILGVGLLALLVIAVLVIVRNIEISKKNRVLVANVNALLDQRKKELLFRKPAAAEDTASTDEEEEASSLSIVQRYIYELTSKELFRDPDFDRNALLDELKLQKNGFWKLFEEETGMTAVKYISNLRLEYAAEQIREHPEYTVEAIACDAGIPSRTTFYRNFTNRFGITPTVFREECNSAVDE